MVNLTFFSLKWNLKKRDRESEKEKEIIYAERRPVFNHSNMADRVDGFESKVLTVKQQK